ncbi:hypothetical protein GGI04_001824 [Coemansia thaxteri]|uniref:BHLH domain-containing protein n=1 Tax=Coemansia thaxteri TaxID=2663907 RepID=A0A9W8BJD0_9FUNG|nr:hypothetical protein H4R26_003185 [Coemansia thaxteri]KAJ2006615.1 hypothetical protein GGI04_001824 [Coemansia thaxteri]
MSYVSSHRSSLVRSTGQPHQPPAPTSPGAYPHHATGPFHGQYMHSPAYAEGAPHQPATSAHGVYPQYYQEPPAAVGYDDRTHHHASGAMIAEVGSWAATAASSGTFHPGSMAAGNAEEREQKRRVSHSAMERRRRERTNNIISELRGLIPWLRDEARLQKLEVLEQCVCYIKELQKKDRAQKAGSRHDQPAAPSADELRPAAKRQRRESSLSRGSAGSHDEDADSHLSGDCDDVDDSSSVHRVSFSSPLPSPSSQNRRREQRGSAVTPTHAAAAPLSFSRASAGSTTAARSLSPAVHAAAAAAPLPLYSAACPPLLPGSRRGSVGDMPCGYWGSAHAGADDHHSLDALPGNVPDLVPSSASSASSKASSTVSTIPPSRAPQHREQPAAEKEYPQVKSSIGFLTS